ncbi:Rhodanese-like domain-containing protein [Sulfidibacter corallicola]|uniref:Rhodanese-like domain-containing protein n=1 Tax=Sulfidibacter corallicola TaxID=2818388 RepID=A0A8A4TPQ6_SULCO|nr:rhodanese-like domain-containing protein [Sulfidibacter corallicola]QTD51062.1 rhodanese-like domain-containing protein [Sulfidibacter corallicola]
MFKNKVRVVSLCLLVAALTVCTESQTESQTKSQINLAVDVATFDQAIKKEMAVEGQAVLLDVRTPEEFKQGHIAGAELMNFHDPKFQARLGKLAKDKTYLVYCRSGGRSGKTAKMMKELGFVRVYDLAGGMIDWNKKSMPVKKNQE